MKKKQVKAPAISRAMIRQKLRETNGERILTGLREAVKHAKSAPPSGSPFTVGYKTGVQYALKTHRVFMCKIDFDEEFGISADPTKVYASRGGLMKDHPSADDCGIVEVEIRLVEVISYGT